MATRVFLSGVRSRGHLLYVSAYLRHLAGDAARSPVQVVDLGLGSFLGAPRVTPADLAAGLPVGPRLRLTSASTAADWRARPGERVVYLAVGAPGIKPYLRLLAANRRRPRCVVVDEGLGSYGGWRSRWAAYRRQGGRGPWPPLRALAVAGAARYLTDERWALHRRSAAGWRLDPVIVAELRRGAAAGLPVRPAAGRPAGTSAGMSAGTAARSAVLVSQPWVELGQVPAARYRQVVAELQSACAAAGLTLVVRPHPAEDADRYAGLTRIDSRLPAEVDPAVLAATVVLGFNSTALVNLAAVHGMAVLRVAVPELAAVEAGMSAAQRALLDAYLAPAVPPGDLPARLRALDATGARVRGSR